MNIPQGLYEVIVSKKINPADKIDAIRNFAKPIWDLDDNVIVSPDITEEDAELIIGALK